MTATSSAESAPLAPSDLEGERRDAFAGRLFQATIEGLELCTIFLGDRLGFYRALADYGPATSSELAARAGTAPRYTREWLEQQAVAGILEVEDASADAEARRYRLPAAHAEVLLDRLSLSYLGPVGRSLAVLAARVPTLVEAFRSGRGVPWSSYGLDVTEVQADLNRPAFVNLLGSDWLPAIPDVDARLRADPPARVADFGCGAGWSSIAIARAYPTVQIDGFDLDPAAIQMARANAAEAGVADRVRFSVREVADPTLAGRYDLVTAFECVHDLGRPIETLRVIRGLLAPGGAVLVMDERVAETFTAPGDETERFFYAFSPLLCLPAGLADGPDATGTVMRPATLRRYAQAAGFRDVEVLTIEHPFWRFYRLTV